VRQLDLTSKAQCEALLPELARRYGRLGGIFHAAGLAQLASLGDIGAGLLEAELEPKALGTANLKAAIERVWAVRGISPRFVMTFSSLAAVLGGLGMAAYACANRVMDALAASPGPGGTRWIPVRWDDWDFAYGKEQVGAYAQTRAGMSIAPEEGLAAIEAILGEPSLRDVLVSATPLEPRLERWVNRAPASAVLPDGPAPLDAGSGVPSAISGLTPEEECVRAAYAKVLGAENAGLDDNFFELGGDSLLATQIVLELGRSLGRPAGLRITDVFDCPSIRKLAARLSASSALTRPEKPLIPSSKNLDNDGPGDAP
jgi:hypothetical protein